MWPERCRAGARSRQPVLKGFAMAKTNEFVLGVDLDGVCADFYGGLRPIAAEWLEVDPATLTDRVSYGLAEWGVPEAPGGYEDLHRFAVTQCEFFRRLRPMPGCPMALRKLSKAGIRIRIITHRLFIKYFHQQAVAQTIEWLERFGIPYWDLCFMRDKAAVGADLYIEDAPENVAALRADGHEVIVFANSTNPDCAPPRAASWDEVYERVLSSHGRWQSAAGQTPHAGSL